MRRGTCSRVSWVIPVLAGLTLGACSPGTTAPEADCPWGLPDVCGHWRLVLISGGIGGGGYPVEGDPELTLRPDSTFAAHEDTVHADGAYQIFRYDGAGNLWADSIWVIVLNDTTGSPAFRGMRRIQSRGPDELELNDMYVDGFNYHFERVGTGS